MTRSAAAPQFLKNMPEVRQQTMASQVRMDDLYATGTSHGLRHILEHLKHPAALKVQQHGTSEDYEYLKRLRSPREDALESQSNPRYVQKVVSTTASRVTISVWSERRVRRTRSACRPRENRIQLSSRIFELHCHGDKQCEINLLAWYMVSPAKRKQYNGPSAWSDTQLDHGTRMETRKFILFSSVQT